MTDELYQALCRVRGINRFVVVARERFDRLDPALLARVTKDAISDPRFKADAQELMAEVARGLPDRRGSRLDQLLGTGKNYANSYYLNVQYLLEREPAYLKAREQVKELNKPIEKPAYIPPEEEAYESPPGPPKPEKIIKPAFTSQVHEKLLALRNELRELIFPEMEMGMYDTMARACKLGAEDRSRLISAVGAYQARNYNPFTFGAYDDDIHDGLRGMIADLKIPDEEKQAKLERFDQLWQELKKETEYDTRGGLGGFGTNTREK